MAACGHAGRPPNGAVGLAHLFAFVVEGRAPEWAKLDWDDREAKRRDCAAWIAGKIREWADLRAEEG
jgi:hypothetical protein